MAEIKVQERRGGLGWLWALIALIVIALVLWYLLSDRDATSGAAVDTISMQLQSIPTMLASLGAPTLG
ncbi:MAG TPA: hypothetical protein VJ596_10580 [Gemmatimonadaceae bacterium]|nr:hypothetical protein [Gemmatimonadaceae bacterium]